MKKVLNTVKILAIALILLVSTGCVKYNTTMEIIDNVVITNFLFFSLWFILTPIFISIIY